MSPNGKVTVRVSSPPASVLFHYLLDFNYMLNAVIITSKVSLNILYRYNTLTGIGSGYCGYGYPTMLVMYYKVHEYVAYLSRMTKTIIGAHSRRYYSSHQISGWSVA